MKNLFILVFIILLALIQASLLPFNFLFGLVSLLSILISSWEVFGYAFLAGVFLDLFSGSTLGFSSLGFLAIPFIFSSYGGRFSFKNPPTLAIFVFLGNFVFSFFSQKPFFIKEALLWAATFFILRIFAPRLFETFPSFKEQKIKV